MKYYLLEIAKGDSKIARKGVYTYQDITSAIAAFHKKMGTAMGFRALHFRTRCCYWRRWRNT